jgi:uncharacterized protein (TIGR03435 family)
MRHTAGFVSALLFGAVLSTAQSGAGKAHGPSPISNPPRFEVASVREDRSGGAPASNIPLDRSDTFSPVGCTLRSINQPFVAFLIFAYNLRVTEFRGGLMRSLPTWAVKDRFDIIAKCESPTVTKDDMRRMMQSLLADRFNMKVHRASKEFSVLAISLRKWGALGPQLKRHDSGCSSPLPAVQRTATTAELLGKWPALCGNGEEIRLSRTRVREGGRAMTMDQIADWISGAGDLELPVVNRSNLEGTYDFILEFVPNKLEDAIPSGAEKDKSEPNFQEAVEDQLGMRLKKERAVIPLFFVDHLEYPSAN